MATTLEDDLGDPERWTVPSIVELMRESRRLSENIHSAEMDVQRIDKLAKLLDEYRRRDKEKYTKQLSVSLIRETES